MLRLLVGGDAVHLHAGLGAGDHQRLVGGNRPPGEQLRGVAHHTSVVLRVALRHGDPPPMFERGEQLRQVQAGAGRGVRRVEGGDVGGQR